MRKILISSLLIVSNANATPQDEVNLVRSKEQVIGCQFINNIDLTNRRKTLGLIKYLKNETHRLGGDTLLFITKVLNETYDTSDVKIKDMKVYKCK
ncbi:hypothetical protein [Catenovulum adriaticum]|uniref:DUF4156 domain-containing protein n=1 Tax=Catenovulum adriaticum TaxID=2984846 RepID=A0ABY7AVC7_9ALTE|nr:hypothetical protein [Catenovulum sp. TS8]WAJ72460.1 DUF4156 domain-containing protein [Catenovulum sp. TS8]